MKPQLKKELTIGATVIASIIVLIFGIDYLKGINIFKAANYYYCTYHNVAGLSVASPVTLNGYKVGLVRDITYEYDNPGNIRVEFSLDKALKVTRGSRAMIVNDLLGTSSVELQLAPGNDYLPVGADIEGDTAAGLLDALSTTVMPTFGAMAERVDSLLMSLNNIASDPALISAIKHLDNVMAALEGTTANLNRAMAQAPGIVNNASATMEDVKAIASNLNSISEALVEVSAALKDAQLDSTLNNVNQISNNMLALSQQLSDPNSSLGLLLSDPALYNNLTNITEDLDSILVDLKRKPKRYIPSIKLF